MENKYKTGDKVVLKIETLPEYVLCQIDRLGIIHTVDNSSNCNCIHLSTNSFMYNFKAENVMPYVTDWKQRYKK